MAQDEDLRVGKAGLPPLVECHRVGGGKPTFPTLRLGNSLERLKREGPQILKRV